jgi:hypothetical protein
MYDSFLDTDDALDPNKADVKTDSINLMAKNGNCEKLFIGYRYSTTRVDKGFLFEDTVVDIKMKIVDYIPDGTVPTQMLGLDYNIIYWVEIFAKHTNTITFIKFSKIQDVLANLGGVINIFKIGFGIIFTIINYYDLPFTVFSEAEIYNKSIYIEKTNINDRLFNYKKDSELVIRPISFVNQSLKIPQHSIAQSSAPDISQTETKHENMTRLEVGFHKYCWANCTNKVQLRKYMKIILDKVGKELEIKNYFRTKEDICLLKSVLFAPEEYEIFNNRHDFRDICRALDDDSDLYDGFHGYLKRSYATEKYKPEKITKYDFIIRNLRKKYGNMNHPYNKNDKITIH